MKRLIRKAEEEYQEDPYLGKYTEIVNRKSKYFGYYAWVDEKLSSDDRYKLYIEPKSYDLDNEHYHINFIKKWDAPKWLNIITYEEAQQAQQQMENQKEK
ncbi:hypothetical protein D3C71_1659270 [compost metagenome]